MQGKTADELAALTVQMGGAIESMARTPQGQPTPQVRPNVQINGDPDAYIDQRTYQQGIADLSQQANQTYGPAIQQAMQMSADANLGHIEREFSREFAKYRPEIHRELATIPYHLRTLDNLRKVVKFVLADHVDDLAHERATQLMAEQSPTLRAGSGGAPPSGPTADALKFDQLPESYRQTMTRMGITWDTVQDFCRANGEDPKKWLDDATKMQKSGTLMVDTPRGRTSTI